MPGPSKAANMQKSFEFLDQCLAGQTHFADADFSHLVLYRAILGELTLDRANLSQARLDSVSLRSASLIEANLEQAQLNQAVLEHCNFTRACLQAATLQGANLSHATLDTANLQNADLSGAQLNHAHLEGADLRGACLEETNLQGATYCDLTQFDATFDPKRAGMTHINEVSPSVLPEPVAAPTAATTEDTYIYYRGARVRRPASPAPVASPQPDGSTKKSPQRRYRGAIIS